MGFLDGLMALGQAAGIWSYYYSMYSNYDDEDLVDEFCRLWKLKYNYEASEDDKIKLTVIKCIIDKRQLFEIND